MTFLCQTEPINEALITAARIAPHQVALVKPSKTQLKVLNSIKAGEKVTAAQIAHRCDLSESWASTLLKRLYENTISRELEECVNVGGVEFRYYRVN